MSNIPILHTTAAMHGGNCALDLRTSVLKMKHTWRYAKKRSASKKSRSPPTMIGPKNNENGKKRSRIRRPCKSELELPFLTFDFHDNRPKEPLQWLGCQADASKGIPSVSIVIQITKRMQMDKEGAICGSTPWLLSSSNCHFCPNFQDNHTKKSLQPLVRQHTASKQSHSFSTTIGLQTKYTWAKKEQKRMEEGDKK